MNRKRLLYIILPLAMIWLASTPVSSKIKLRYGPYLQNVTDTEATIVWESDTLSVGWVEIAPDDGTNFYTVHRPQFFDTRNGVKKVSELHAVKIKGLQPGTRYRYRVYAKEVLKRRYIMVYYGDVAASTPNTPPTFKTLDKQQAEASFAVINDLHSHSEWIEPLLKKADFSKRDAIIYNGDMTSIFENRDTIFKNFMSETIRVFAQQQCVYYVRGNHETRGQFAEHFQDYFNPKEPTLYYMFRQGPICFIMLDTGEDKPDDDIEYGSIVDYDNYRREQAEWLKEVAQSPDFQTARYRVVIGHMPTRNMKDDWHGMQQCAQLFTPILNDMHIDVMIGGHLHEQAFHEPDSSIQYPVLVNNTQSIIVAQTEGNELNIRIFNLKGKETFRHTFKAQR